jgi:Papain-like cysteine protease AvrRpt2
MNTIKKIPTRWKLIALGSLGILIFAGFTQVAARSSVSRLQTEPIFLDVPVVKQATGTSCGEAVIAMAYNFAHPQSAISEAEVTEYAIANGYYTPESFPYTSPASMVKLAEYYADKVDHGTVRTQSQGLSLLLGKLRRAEPVTIDVLSNFRDPDSEAHFIVVTGISVDAERSNAVVIHYNDPLTGTRKSSDWSGSEGVWNAWQKNGDPGGAGWWLVISPE